MNTLALLLWINLLGSPVYADREHAQTHLLTKHPTELEWKILKSGASNCQEMYRWRVRITHVWAGRLCDSCLPEGAYVYPDVDSARGLVTLSYVNDEEAVARDRHTIWCLKYRVGVDNPSPYIADRRALKFGCVQYLLASGDLPTIRKVLSEAYKREVYSGYYPKLVSLLGVPLLQPHDFWGSHYTYAPDILNQR